MGAALSNSIAGTAGYSVAFLFLVSCAGAAFVLFWAAVPETGRATVDGAHRASPVAIG
jgi:hypothetical protein